MSDEETVDLLELMLNHDDEEQFCPVNLAKDPEVDRPDGVDLSVLPCLCVLIKTVRMDQSTFVIRVLHQSSMSMAKAGDTNSALVLHHTAMALGDMVKALDEGDDE
jgi:hypothetical protein